MKKQLFTALLSIGSCAATAADPSNMQPGLWAITTEMEMPGMPMKMPPQTMRHCYTAKDLERGQNTVPQSRNGNCTVKDYSLKGNTATWSIECTGPNAMRGTGSMTTTATSYTGTMKSVINNPGGRMEMTSHLNAKRVGNCN